MKVASSIRSDLERAPALSGRGYECQILRQAYLRSKRRGSSCASSAAPPTLQQELVLVHGRSGTGKTVLTNFIVDEAIQQDSAIVLSGKFELSSFQHPYKVFVDAFAKLPHMVQNLALFSLDAMRQAVIEAVGTEGKLLTRMIPALQDFIGQQQEQDECQVHGKDALHRLQFVFSKFVRAVSSFAPLILFFDDLQWSDPASLNFLMALLECQSDSQQPSSLFIVCAFRDEGPNNNIDEQGYDLLPQTSRQPVFPKFLKDFLEQASSSPLINVSKILLSNLDEQATSQVVADRLNLSMTLSMKLGEILFIATEGNPFHIVQLLSPLMISQTADGNHDLVRRVMAGEDIFEMTEADETVDELLRQRFLLFPEQVQHVLQVAACIGDVIDHPALSTVCDGDSIATDECLQLSSEKGFLVFEARLALCRFTHDRVRQVVLSMIDNKNAMYFDIGYKLWTTSSPMFLTNKMFVVANLLNHGTNLLHGQSERYKAAALNLEAGCNAVAMSAFQDAARFLNAGIEFLQGGDYWNGDYELSLNLISAAAEAELCNQDFERVTCLVQEVLENARCVKDKLRAYVVQINSLGQRCNMESAVRVGTDVMRQLGEPVPHTASNTSIIIEIVKTRMALRGRSNERLLALPPMQDENKLACTYVLTNLMPYAFQASSNFVVVIAARLVRLCLKYGMHKSSACGFSAFGFVLCPINRKEGYRLGELALKIVERYGARELLPRIYVNFYGLVHHWRCPLEGCLKQLEIASKVGMEVGDVEHATLAFTTYATHSLYHGKPLSRVNDIIDDAIQRLRILRQDGLLALLEISRNFVHMIMGKVGLTDFLSVDASLHTNSSPDIDSKLIPYVDYFLISKLAYLFGDLSLASHMMQRNRNLGFQPLASYLYIKVRFLEALICTGLARNDSPGRKRNISTAKRDLKQLKAWAIDCPQNFLNKQRLVEAELESLTVTATSSVERKSHVQWLYDQSFDVALNEGFVQEAALARELAGDFQSNILHDLIKARDYWREAHSLYMEWGATAKANQVLSARGI